MKNGFGLLSGCLFLFAKTCCLHHLWGWKKSQKLLSYEHGLGEFQGVSESPWTGKLLGRMGAHFTINQGGPRGLQSPRLHISRSWEDEIWLMVLRLLMLTFKIIKFQRQGKDLEKVKQRLIEIANHVDKVSSLGVIKSLMVMCLIWEWGGDRNTPHLTGRLASASIFNHFLWRPPGLGIAVGDAPMLSGPWCARDPPPHPGLPSWILNQMAHVTTQRRPVGLSPGLLGQVPATWGRLSSIRNLRASRSPGMWQLAFGPTCCRKNSSPWTREELTFAKVTLELDEILKVWSGLGVFALTSFATVHKVK